jgi:hypothetical protein
VLTPEQQLLAARGLMGQQQQHGYEQAPSTYISRAEQQASSQAAGLANVGASAVIGAPLALGMAGMFAGRKGGLGKVMRGVDIGASAFDPFSMAFQAIPRIGKARGGIGVGIAGAGMAIGGAALAYGGISTSADYIKNQVLEGQRNFLATRAMLRTLPQSGFGQQSVIGGQGGQLGSYQNTFQMQREIQGIGSQNGMSQGQARRLMGGMGQMGMINTSSIGSISSTFKSSLKELEKVAKTIGGDIDEALKMYQSLDRMGFRSKLSRGRMLGQMTATSGLTGMSLESVGAHVSAGTQQATSMGINGEIGGRLALKSLNTSAYLSSVGGIDKQYLASQGGSYQGVAARMTQLQLGTLSSRGGLTQLSNAFTPGGGINSEGLNKLMAGDKANLRGGHLAKFDPYALTGMQEQLGEMQSAMMLSRVNRIHQDHIKDPLKANREQYKYLASMGIGDPSEQLQFLRQLRAAPTAQFSSALQGLQNQGTIGQDESMKAVQSASDGWNRLINRISRSLSSTFQQAGAALQRDLEGSNRRISVALHGWTPTRSGVDTDMGRMRGVQKGILSGAIQAPSEDRVLGETQSLLRNSALLRESIGSSVNVRGVDSVTRAGLLQGPWDNARYGAASASRWVGEKLSGIGNVVSNQLLGEPGREFSRRRSGSMAEMLPKDGRNVPGGINVGEDRWGRARTVSSQKFMGLMANRYGLEWDESLAGGTGGITRWDQSRVDQMSRLHGVGFGNEFKSGVGAHLLETVKTQQTNDFSLGGKIAGAITFGGAGMAAGALGGGLVGAVGGAVIGGIAGWNGGGMIAKGVKGIADGYAESQGVDTSPVLTTETLKEMGLKREDILGSDKGTKLIQTMFKGETWQSLSPHKRRLVNEMLRRHGGQSGQALAGKAPEGEMDAYAFNAEMQGLGATASVGNLFGVGGSARSTREFGNRSISGSAYDGDFWSGTDLRYTPEGAENTDKYRLGLAVNQLAMAMPGGPGGKDFGGGEQGARKRQKAIVSAVQNRLMKDGKFNPDTIRKELDRARSRKGRAVILDEEGDRNQMLDSLSREFKYLFNEGNSLDAYSEPFVLEGADMGLAKGERDVFPSDYYTDENQLQLKASRLPELVGAAQGVAFAKASGDLEKGLKAIDAKPGMSSQMKAEAKRVLVDTLAAQKINPKDNPNGFDQLKKAMIKGAGGMTDGEKKSLEKAGVITPAGLAAVVGNWDSVSADKAMGMADKALKGTNARTLSSFMGARNLQVKHRMSNLKTRRSKELSNFFSGFDVDPKADSFGSFTNLLTASQGDTPLIEQLEGNPELRGDLMKVRDALQARILKGEDDPKLLAGMESQLKVLNSAMALATPGEGGGTRNGVRDFAASVVGRAGFSQKGGKTSMDMGAFVREAGASGVNVGRGWGKGLGAIAKGLGKGGVAEKDLKAFFGASDREGVLKHFGDQFGEGSEKDRWNAFQRAIKRGDSGLAKTFNKQLENAVVAGSDLAGDDKFKREEASREMPENIKKIASLLGDSWIITAGGAEIAKALSSGQVSAPPNGGTKKPENNQPK